MDTSFELNGYIMIMLWCGLIVGLTKIRELRRPTVINDEIEMRYPIWFGVLLFLPLLWMVASRQIVVSQGIVGDTGAYIKTFMHSPDVFADLPEYVQGLKKEKTFYTLTAIIHIIVGDRERVYLFVLVAIQAYFLSRVYRKYSPNYVLSFFLFIASTDYISWMYNGIRQFLAVSITFGAFPFILQKKYVRAILMVMIGFLFHQTALLVIPFIFVAQGKAWNKKTLLFIAAVLAIITSVDAFTDFLEQMLKNTSYENIVGQWEEWEDDGTNPLRVAVYSVPAILSLLGRKKLREVDDPVINLCTNMSIAAAGFYVISMMTSGIYIGRIPIYFSLYSYILLPWEVENLFTYRSRKILYGSLVVLYLIYYYYQMQITYGLLW